MKFFGEKEENLLIRARKIQSKIFIFCGMIYISIQLFFFFHQIHFSHLFVIHSTLDHTGLIECKLLCIVFKRFERKTI